MSRPTAGLVFLLVAAAAQVAMCSEPMVKFDQIRSCTECIAAGFGWSVRKGKCGHFANYDCPSGVHGHMGGQKRGSEEQRDERPVLPHRFPHSAWLPRITLDELRTNETLQSGTVPFVLVGAAEHWLARSLWNVSWFVAQHPKLDVDFYNNGLRNFFQDHAEHHSWAEAGPKFDAGRGGPTAPYIIWRHTVDSWDALAPHIDGLPDFFNSQTAMLRECVTTGSDSDSQERWDKLFSMLIWRMVMVGQDGSRFRLHYDNTDLASWQAIVLGAKRFFICAPSETPHLAEIRYVHIMCVRSDAVLLGARSVLLARLAWLPSVLIAAPCGLMACRGQDGKARHWGGREQLQPLATDQPPRDPYMNYGQHTGQSMVCHAYVLCCAEPSSS
jgi:hypothetical protein